MELIFSNRIDVTFNKLWNLDDFNNRLSNFAFLISENKSGSHSELLSHNSLYSDEYK